MKITCQSCGAKYTVADEKVRGKTVKIRCKKCSSAIVVDGSVLDQPGRMDDEEDDGETRIYENPIVPESSGAKPAAEWTVTLSSGEQQPVSLAELMKLYSAGSITNDSYAWKEGMEDWKPLNEIAELAPILSQETAAAAPQASAPQEAAPQSGAGQGAALFGGESGGRVAARRAEARPKDQDLFGGPKPVAEDEGGQAASGSASIAPLPKPSLFTAERNENSVLFTLDALKATAPAGSAGAFAPQKRSPQESVVDLKKLASVAPPPPKKNDIDDLMNLGGGLDGMGGGASLAAPNFALEAPPEPPPPPAFSEPMPSASVGAPAQKSNGLVIALVGVIALLVVGGGIGGYVVLGRKAAAPATTAATTATAEAKPAATAAETAATANAAPAATPTEAPAATAAAAATETAKAAVGGPLPTAGGAAAGPAAAGKGKTPDSPKPDDKAAAAPPTPAPAETAAAGGGSAPFDRGAAVSALSGAASAAAGCKTADGPTGSGRVSVTFAPTGRVTTAVVEGAPFAGTSVGGCVASRFRGAKVPPFAGSPVTVHKSFSVQ